VIEAASRNDAVKAFAADPFIEETAGKRRRDPFIHYKSKEWCEYHPGVSDGEIRRFARLF